MTKNKPKTISKEIVVYRPPKAMQKRKKKTRGKQRGKSLTSLFNKVGPLTRRLACSQLDPWACNACIPDGSQGTGCFSVKEDYVLGTGTTGTACAVAQATGAGPQAQSYVDTGSSATTPTLTGNWTKAVNIASMVALYAKYRPISGGLRGTYVGNTQTDGGIIIVGSVSGGVPLSTFNGVSLVTAQANFNKYKVYPLREGFKVTWRAEDMDDTMQFTTLSNTAVAVTSGFNQPYILAIVYGANLNTASMLHVEAVANYEGQFESQTFMPGGLNQDYNEPAEAGWYERARDIIQQIPQIESFIPTVASAVGRQFGAALGSMANGLLSPGRMSASGLPLLKYK